MRRVVLALCALVLALMLSTPATAVQPDEKLADPALEARAREIGRHLRCLVCQNQSIDDSDAGLARDLRLLVRERLTAGASDAEVIDHIVARYGDYVLLRPPVKPATYLLWAAPVLILAGGTGGLVVAWRRRRRAAEPAPLSDEERRRLAALLEDDPS